MLRRPCWDDAPVAAAGSFHITLLYVKGLSSLPADKVHEIWRITGATPESAGTFPPPIRSEAVLA